MYWTIFKALYTLTPLVFKDGTANDIPSDLAVQGYPTIYFYSTSGNLITYEGERTADAIISFIKENKGPKADSVAAVDELSHTGAGAAEEIALSSSAESVKDEL